jgi:hypothetical protein
VRATETSGYLRCDQASFPNDQQYRQRFRGMTLRTHSHPPPVSLKNAFQRPRLNPPDRPCRACKPGLSSFIDSPQAQTRREGPTSQHRSGFAPTSAGAPTPVKRRSLSSSISTHKLTTALERLLHEISERTGTGSISPVSFYRAAPSRNYACAFFQGRDPDATALPGVPVSVCWV